MTEALLCEDGGLFSTVQDLGRFGYARFGISASGAMDGLAIRLANALVGNPMEAAAIEATLSGPVVTLETERARLAFAGMEARITLNGATVAPWRAFEARRGDRIAILPGPSGLRGYLAVAGGIAVPAILGSRSTHTRSALGGLDGRALRAGDRLPLATCAVDGFCLELPSERRPTYAGPVRVVLGPQDDRFSPEGITTFLGSEYRVSDKTDRMGCQLDGPVIAHRDGFNIVSDGIVNGSIQVPGHGRPIVLLADRQTTGGYPKIATVVGADLRILAQARPGTTLRFKAVSAGEAEAIAGEAHRTLEACVAALRPAEDGLAALTAERLLGLNLIGGVVDACAE